MVRLTQAAFMLERRFSLDMPSDKARERMQWILKTELRTFEAGGQEFRQTYGHSPNRDGTHSLSIPFARASAPTWDEPDLLRPIRIEYMPAPGNITEIRATCTEPAFEEYLDRFISRVKGDIQSTQEPTETDRREYPNLLPARPETRERWKKRYRCLVECHKIYRERYDSGDTDDPEPKMADYVDYLASEEGTGEKLDESTVRRVKKAGDAGCLG